ncbi:hypothetical protein [Lentzea sp. NPDC003310]|uniref:hypothetical protein n=1 Tax=Lentzea sp. NPDC003310 TaxID=3154447 RepID=UPI0033BF6848
MPVIASSVSAVAGSAGAIVAATALRKNREDQARRDAAGLHATARIVICKVDPPGDDLILEPDLRNGYPDSQFAIKVANTSAHPYYAVVSSVYVPARNKRYAAYVNAVPANEARYARMFRSDGCDVVALPNDTLIDTTFVDSQGRGWHRDSHGVLRRRRISRRWRDAQLWARPHRGLALHQMSEVVIQDADGAELHVVRDWNDIEVEVTPFRPSLTDRDLEDAIRAYDLK